jgi:hypothetical protein
MSAPIMSAETIEQFAKSADRLKEAIVLLKLALAHGRDPSLEMSELDLWLKSFFYDLASASIAAAKREAATGRHMIVHSEADAPINVCRTCGADMVLHFWDRPGGPPGNGFRCHKCNPPDDVPEAEESKPLMKPGR